MRQNQQASKAPTPSYGSQEEHSFCQKKLSTKSLASLERAVTADNGGQRLRFGEYLADIAGFIQIKFTYLLTYNLRETESIGGNLLVLVLISGRYCMDDVNECEVSNPCQNSGTCVNTLGGFYCVCVNGWTNYDCSVNMDDCADRPCYNGGTCHDRVATFYCECPRGKTGNYLTFFYRIPGPTQPGHPSVIKVKLRRVELNSTQLKFIEKR